MSYSVAEVLARAMNWALAVGLPVFVSPSDYGTIVLVMTTEIILVPLVVLGQSTAILRFHRRQGYDGPSFLAHVFYTWIRIAVGIVGISFLILLIFSGSESARTYILPLALLVGLSPLLAVRELLLSYYRAEGKALDYVKSRLLQQTVKSIVVSVGVWLGFGSLAYVGGIAASAVVPLVLDSRLLRGVLGAVLGPSRPSIDWGLIRFGIPISIYQLIGSARMYADRYIIGFVAGMDQLGRYNLFYSFGSGLVLLMTVTSVSFLPILYKEDGVTKRAERLLSLYSDAIIMVCALISLGLSTCFPLIANRIYAPDYLGEQSIMALILLGYLLQPLYLQAEYRLTLGRLTHVLPPIMALVAVINGVLSLILVRHLGMQGAAISLVLSNVFSACIFAWYSRCKTQAVQLNRATLLVVVTSAVIACAFANIAWVTQVSLVIVLVWSIVSVLRLLRC